MDRIVATNNITTWGNVIGDLPPLLQEKLDLFQAVLQVESPLQHPDVSNLSVKTLESSINGYALALASDAHHRDARLAYRDQIAREVLKLAGVHAEAIRDKNAKRFGDIAATYVKSVQALPQSATPADLIRYGGVEEYRTAVECESVLLAYQQWLVSLSALPIYAGMQFDTVLAVVSPTGGRADYQDLLNTTAEIEGLTPHLLHAATNPDRYQFRLQLPNEIAVFIQAANDEEAPSRFGGFSKQITDNGVSRLMQSDGVTPVAG